MKSGTRTVIVWLIALLGLPPLAVGQMPHGHESDAAECAGRPTDLKAVVAAMDRPGRKLEALASRSDMAPLTPGLERLEITLRPSDQVVLVATPKTAEKVEGQSFAGFLLFSVPKDGNYRVSSGSAFWLDVLDGDKALERAKLNRRMQCGHVHKSLGFSLRAGVSHWLQLSSSKGRDVHVMVTSE